MSTVLVTGGAGFVGSHIVDLLVKRGHQVIVYDNLAHGKLENLMNARSHCEFLYGDVEDAKLLLGAMRTWKPDVICHQAAQISLPFSVEQPAFDARVNILGTINVIEAARRVGARVVMASTGALYSGAIPFREEFPVDPRRPYAIAKYAAELYLQNSGLSYVILRYGNIYGPRQARAGESQVVPCVLDHIYQGMPFKINGDGEQTRDFVYVADAAMANVMAIEDSWSVQGIYNISTGKGQSINHVVGLLARHTGFSGIKGAGRFEHGPEIPNEVRHTVLDPSWAARFLRWQACTSLDEGLRRTVEWYEAATKEASEVCA